MKGPNNEKRRPAVEIREMEIDDLAPVFHLGERLFTSKKVPTLYRTWDEYEVTNIFQTESEFCLVSEVDDKPIGFALGTTITKTRSAWKYGHLVWLGVDPDFQRLGVARRLFNHFRDKMEEHGVRILLVDTEADNEQALAFFRDMGFGNPEEHLYLALNLDQQQPRKTNSKRT
jgi:ribosomal protein S18 acetylase RimI-like enzyme